MLNINQHHANNICNQVLWSDEAKTEMRDRCVVKVPAFRQTIDTVRQDEKDLLLHKLSLGIAAESLPGKEEAEGDLGLERNRS